MIELASGASQHLFEAAFVFAARQLRTLVERYPDFYPMYTAGGRWKHTGEAWTHWCDGFLPGMLWIVYSRQPAGSDESRWWRAQAIRYSRPLEPRKLDREVHDLGFVFMSSYYRWYGFTPDPALKAVLVEAGRTMALRFQEKGQYLRSFIAPESLFIDIMMNVGIVFFAARETGDRALLDIAWRHCQTTRRVLVRGDGSTAHEGLFDPATGEFLRQSTHQGYRGDSCWSRGLAWSLYGFGTAYRYVRDSSLLATAEACADFYIRHTPPHGVPPWDYDAPPESGVLPDTSAAAIACSGLFQLSELLADAAKGHFYCETARHILATLCRDWLADSDPQWEGILKGGVYHIYKNLGVNESVMWGEYFFLEALESALRARSRQFTAA
ncbi:MAG TPA: glycoside hydrolase family 88 protein [Bryobacteraceae bacterium]|nr:glycoside hydrolase family 88 protein [Bryobacteraceae bacterium]